MYNNLLLACHSTHLINFSIRNTNSNWEWADFCIYSECQFTLLIGWKLFTG